MHGKGFPAAKKYLVFVLVENSIFGSKYLLSDWKTLKVLVHVFISYWAPNVPQ